MSSGITATSIFKQPQTFPTFVSSVSAVTALTTPAVYCDFSNCSFAEKIRLTATVLSLLKYPQDSPVVLFVVYTALKSLFPSMVSNIMTSSTTLALDHRVVNNIDDLEAALTVLDVNTPIYQRSGSFPLEVHVALNSSLRELHADVENCTNRDCLMYFGLILFLSMKTTPVARMGDIIDRRAIALQNRCGATSDNALIGVSRQLPIMNPLTGTHVTSTFDTFAECRSAIVRSMLDSIYHPKIPGYDPIIVSLELMKNMKLAAMDLIELVILQKYPCLLTMTELRPALMSYLNSVKLAGGLPPQYVSWYKAVYPQLTNLFHRNDLGILIALSAALRKEYEPSWNSYTVAYNLPPQVLAKAKSLIATQELLSMSSTMLSQIQGLGYNDATDMVILMDEHSQPPKA